ncbi:MAG: hypothetical protein ACLPTJ_13900 [Solirubrobacteraceae bacterium]
MKELQLAQEEVAREALEDAVNEADAAKQERRADKARYLREKLQERERSEAEAARED